jgi:hypothetical protein
MNRQKRAFLASLSSVVACAVAGMTGARAVAQSGGPPQSDGMTIPRQQQQSPPLFPSSNVDAHLDPKAILQQNDSQIHEDVAKLYFLARELKVEVDKTDSETVLSLAMVQRCEQIEKLARQVKNLAKG